MDEEQDVRVEVVDAQTAEEPRYSCGMWETVSSSDGQLVTQVPVGFALAASGATVDRQTPAQSLAAVFQVSTWRGLSEAERDSLRMHLPAGVAAGSDAEEALLGRLFGGATFHFCNPLASFQRHLFEGHLQPAAVALRKAIRMVASDAALLASKEAEWQLLLNLETALTPVYQSNVQRWMRQLFEEKSCLPSTLAIHGEPLGGEEVVDVVKGKEEDENENADLDGDGEDEEEGRQRRRVGDHLKGIRGNASTSKKVSFLPAPSDGGGGVAANGLSGWEQKYAPLALQQRVEAMGAMALELRRTQRQRMQQQRREASLRRREASKQQARSANLAMVEGGLMAQAKAGEDLPPFLFLALMKRALSALGRPSTVSEIAAEMGSRPDAQLYLVPGLNLEDSVRCAVQFLQQIRPRPPLLAVTGAEGRVSWLQPDVDPMRLESLEILMVYQHTRNQLGIPVQYANESDTKWSFTSTLPAASNEDVETFREEELRRYSAASVPFLYSRPPFASYTRPLRLTVGGTRVTSLPADRPPGVNLSSLVSDALARLPGGVGTKSDALVLVRESQWWMSDAPDPDKESAVLSGAFDRLREQKRPFITYHPECKLWVYMSRVRAPTSDTSDPPPQDDEEEEENSDVVEDEDVDEDEDLLANSPAAESSSSKRHKRQ